MSIQRTQIISKLWDGDQLKCTFRRMFSDEMMIQWHELLSIIRGVTLNGDEDQLIRLYDFNWLYSSSSMYSIVNFRRVQQIFLPPFGS